ncbi:uncharacterized protein LOC144169488 isoform X3 [Haemaphysalis longicornis]
MSKCTTHTTSTMKPAGCAVFFSLLLAISGAAVDSNTNKHSEEDEYRIWGKYPWDQPGNPPPFAPIDDFFLYSQAGQAEQDEKLRSSSVDPQGETTEEYRAWGRFPWERPGNPPPFVPPGDTQFSQIGRWWVKDDQEGNHQTPYSQIGRWWNRDWLEGKSPRFSGTPYSQIGRWWNRDWLEGKSPRFSAIPIIDGNEYGAWGKFPWEKPDSPLPVAPPADQQLSRSRRSLRPPKPWEKPWNPPPILPEPYPPTGY